MSEGVVDLFEVVEVNEEKGQFTQGPVLGCLIGEEEVKHHGELAAITKSGELVSVGLAIALLGQDAQASRREREANAHGQRVAIASPSATRSML